jgi:hypothetical protein
MVLRFRDGAARTCVLPIWRDSVGADTWRLLAVAVLAIGRRSELIAAGQLLSNKDVQ